MATSFTVGKAIAHGLDPAVLTLIRFIIASLVFFPYVLIKENLKRPSLYDLLRYCTISGSIVTFFLLMFWSLRYTTALNTSVIFTTVPGISGIYSVLLLKENLQPSRIAALILAAFGALWVIFHGDLSRLLALECNQGDLLFFLGCLSMAAYPPLVKLLHREESMAVMTFWVMTTACGWLLLVSVYRLPGISWQTVSASIWLGIAYLAIFCTIITFYLTKISTLIIGPVRVISYSYLYPPLVILLDFAFGHPMPEKKTWVGVIFILLAMWVLQKGRKE